MLFAYRFIAISNQLRGTLTIPITQRITKHMQRWMMKAILNLYSKYQKIKTCKQIFLHGRSREGQLAEPKGVRGEKGLRRF